MLEIDDARLHQRHETELYRGGVAARICNQPRALDLAAIDLRQAIYGLLDQIRAGMRDPIPFLPYPDIADAKIGGDIDEPHAGAEQCSCMLHCNAIGRREKYYVTSFQPGLGRIAELQIDAAEQTWKHIADRDTRFLARSDCA